MKLPLGRPWPMQLQTDRAKRLTTRILIEPIAQLKGACLA